MPRKPARWNQAKERATGSDRLSAQINASLDSFRAQVIEVRRGLIAEGLEGNAIQIKERLANPKNTSMMFLAELDKYCIKRQAEVGTHVTQLTANKYHRILRYLREYTAEAYKKEDIQLTAVSYEYISFIYIQVSRVVKYSYKNPSTQPHIRLYSSGANHCTSLSRRNHVICLLA